MHSKRQILATKPGKHGTIYRLIHATKGIEPAGSGTRTRAHEGWLVQWTLRDGQHGGQWYSTEAEAVIKYQLKGLS